MDETPDQPSPAANHRFQSLRGMRDILPEDAVYYRRVEEVLWETAYRHGFAEIRTPLVEPTELFTRTVGESSDIVHKEMYSFTDRSDHAVSLRPEGTAGVARAYLEHGFGSRPQPVKLAYLGNMYRYERPQAGRFREHEQFGLEVFGAADPAIDAEVILATWQAYQALALEGVSVQINSIGDERSRKQIRNVIVDAMRDHRGTLPDDATRQLKQNPLRILDSKDPQMQAIIETIPPLIDQLVPEDRDHFTAVLEYLDQAGVPYELNPRLVRGLDYYTRTVFECWGGEGGQAALGSGGRYDHLIEQLGGPSTPGFGIGIGIDRIVELLKAGRGTEVTKRTPQVFVIQLGDVAKKITFDLIDQLTRAGLSATSAQGRDSIRSQLKLADKLGAPLAVIVGQKEAMDSSIIIRDMASGMQETVPVRDAVREITNRIPGEVTRK